MLKKLFVIFMLFGSLGLTACSSSSLPGADTESTHMFGDFKLGCGSESCM